MRLHDQVAAGAASLNRHRALSVEHNTRGLCIRQHHKIASPQRWPQQCAGSGLACATADRELAQPHALAVRAIQVLAVDVTQAGQSVEEREIEWIRTRDHAHVHRAIAAVVNAATEILVVFAPAKVRQHLAVAPACGATGRPRVKVSRVAPEIHHAIDERRTTQAAPAGQGYAATIELRLGYGLEAPVERGVSLRHHDGAGHVDVQALARAAGLDQAHRAT